MFDEFDGSDYFARGLLASILAIVLIGFIFMLSACTCNDTRETYPFPFDVAQCQ